MHYLTLAYAGAVVPGLLKLLSGAPHFSHLVALCCCDRRFIANVLMTNDLHSMSELLELLQDDKEQSESSFISTLHGVLLGCAQMMESEMLRVQ